MENLEDFIRNNPLYPKIKIDELLFAEFKCPDRNKTGVWWHNNFFAHVLLGEIVLKTPKQEFILKAGDSVFAKKGTVISYGDIHGSFCDLIIFVPDDFIRAVLRKYQLKGEITHSDNGDTIIPLSQSTMLTTYFNSLLTHFYHPSPNEILLKLKFEELLLTIFSTPENNVLRNYLSSICKLTKPSIREIMEANFFSNLSLKEFATLCNRSLSSFKQEFKTIFNTTPGKWLLEKRLEYSRYLLETTDFNIDETCMESGFENKSHFIRTFKNKYGCTPGNFKALKTASTR